MKKTMNMNPTSDKTREQMKFDSIINSTFNWNGKINVDANENVDHRRYFVSIHLLTMVTTKTPKTELEDLQKESMMAVYDIKIREFEKYEKFDTENFKWGNFTTEFNIECCTLDDNRTMDSIFSDMRVLIKTPIQKEMPEETQGYHVEEYISGYDKVLSRFIFDLIGYVQERESDYERYEYKTWI